MNSGVRGQESEVRSQRTEVRGQESGGKGQGARRGMTLVEVILGVAILGILAVVVVNALFYPRLLVVSGTLKQQAIHAGTDALEQAFSKGYNSLPEGTVSLGDLSTRYSVNGRTITGSRDITDVGGVLEYKRIIVTVDYGGDNPVVLRTYRSSL